MEEDGGAPVQLVGELDGVDLRHLEDSNSDTNDEEAHHDRYDLRNRCTETLEQDLDAKFRLIKLWLCLGLGLTMVVTMEKNVTIYRRIRLGDHLYE